MNQGKYIFSQVAEFIPVPSWQRNNIKELFQLVEAEQTQDDGQLQLEFEAC